MAVYFWNNKSGDAELDWLQYGITDLLVQGTIINFTIFLSLKNMTKEGFRTEEAFFLPGREGFFGINWRFRN